MDTSETARQVLGETAIAAHKITGEEWMEIVEFFYTRPMLWQVKPLFPRIGDLIGGIPYHFLKAYVAHGLTRFPKGIGVNSHAHPFSLKWSSFHRKYLLLMRPDPGRYAIPVSLKWASWELQFSSQDGGTRTVGESSVIQHLSREEVVQILEDHPHVCRSLVDVEKPINDYADELANRARALVELRQWVKDVRDRVSF
jgi:hypothetical protein